VSRLQAKQGSVTTRLHAKRPSGTWTRCVPAVTLGAGGLAIAAAVMPGAPSASGSWSHVVRPASYIVEGHSAPGTVLWLDQHGARQVRPIVGFRAAVATLTAVQTREAERAGFRLAPNTKVVMTGEFGSTGSSGAKSATSSPAGPAPDGPGGGGPGPGSSGSPAGTDAYLQVTGAQSVWAGGDEGQGVSVAVLDTGIEVPGPYFSGRVLDGINLSGSGSSTNWNTDDYGHGTFVAGLIGNDPPGPSPQYRGMAPESDLVSIKVAGASGVTTEATVIEGIEWAIQHESADNIRVLNLSLGVQPASPTSVDPIDQAVEQAWQAGIVVVTSAGNAGPDNGSITSPGDDPLVITVGTINDGGGSNPANYSVPGFSSVGPTGYDGWFKPDLAAPGVSVVSLRDPGSTIAKTFPNAAIDGRYFVGSGTSFSTAIVSGAVALVLENDPSLTPDQVKAALLFSASHGPVGDPFVDGHGIVNVPGALAAAGKVALNQAPALGAEGSSGVLTGSSSILFSKTWDASSWNPANWSGSDWLSSPYAADGTGTPATAPESGLTWNGAAWNGAAWNGAAWNGAAWNGAAWNGAAWNGAAWNGAAWNGAAWNGAAWNAAAWNDDQWG